MKIRTTFFGVYSLPLLLLLIAVLGVSGCYSGHSIAWSLDSIVPSDIDIYEDDINHGDRWKYILTEEDKKKGSVDLPELTLKREGYLPLRISAKPNYFQIDEAFYDNYNREGFTGWHGTRVHEYASTGIAKLKKDPGHRGPVNKNKVIVSITSEPRGASIYEDGKYIGRTPYNLNYSIDNFNYKQGLLRGRSLTLVYDGYKPKDAHPKIIIPSEWRYYSGETLDAKSGILIVLHRESYAPNTETSSSQQKNICAHRQRVYNAALNTYNQMLQRSNSSDLLGTLNNMNWASMQYSKPGTDKGLAFLGKLTSDVSRSGAAKDVEIARQNLETARAQLCD
jgi:hypothetical protein